MILYKHRGMWAYCFSYFFLFLTGERTWIQKGCWHWIKSELTLFQLKRSCNIKWDKGPVPSIAAKPGKDLFSPEVYECIVLKYFCLSLLFWNVYAFLKSSDCQLKFQSLSETCDGEPGCGNEFLFKSRGTQISFDGTGTQGFFALPHSLAQVRLG